MSEFFIGNEVWIKEENKAGTIIDMNEQDGWGTYYLVQYKDNPNMFIECYAEDLRQVHAK